MNGMNVGRMEDLVNECCEWKMDMVGLTETHMRDILEITEGESKYKFLGKGRRLQSRKGGGVACMFRKDAEFEVEVMNVGDCDMSEDILAVRVEFSGKLDGRKERLYVCICYMTVEGQNAPIENRRKYEIVQKFVEEHRKEKIIIMGDMNGHIGILGEQMNANGELLRKFCEDMQVEILNETIASGRVTWQSRDSVSAIDYMLANVEAREYVMSMSVDEEGSFNVGSDHNLLLVEYSCRKLEDNKRVNKRRKKWCLRKVDWERFRGDMNQMTGVDVSDVNRMNNDVVENVRAVAKKSIVISKGKPHYGKYNPWWNNEIKSERQDCKKLNKECRMWHRRMNNGEECVEQYEAAWERYKVQKTKVKNLIRNAKMEYENKKVRELRAKGEEGSREWYRFLRGDNHTDGNVSEILVNGNRVCKREDIANEIQKFWKQTCTKDVNEVNDEECVLRIETKDLSCLDKEIERGEIERILKCLKNDKATGMDGIPYEMYKYGGDRVVDMLWNLFNTVWRDERVPEKWNESRVILLHKGGHKSKKELKNYRPIALNDTIGKIFCMCVNERVKEVVEREGVLGEEQNGFRMMRRGEDNMFIVRELIEKCNREGTKGYFAFLDIEKAYDRVNRRMLCKVLKKCGMSEKMVKIIESMYENTKAKYTLGDIETEWVYSNRGVRQGCILSPVLFAMYTEELAVRVKEGNWGMRVGNEKLSLLMYADDIIIMSESSDELQCMLDVVNKYSIDFGVKFGLDKSQVMIINKDHMDVDKNWKLGENQLKNTDEYKYLGVSVNVKGCIKAKSEKIFKANQWYGRLASIARYRANKYLVVRELWKGMAVPSIMYGMNVLNWTECELQKLEVIQNKVGRIALGANRYASVEAIRGDMGWSTFSERNMKGCIMYKLRVERMPSER